MKTIRMKSNFSTQKMISMAFLAGVCMFASCSDNELDEHATEPAKIDVGNVIVNNNAEELSDLVQLYKSSHAATRALTQAVTMPEQPAIPTDAVDVTSNGFQYWKPNGQSFVLKAGQKKSLELNLNNAEWFVEGEMTLKNCWNAGKIYVLPGAKLTFAMQTQTLNDIEIYNYNGTVEWDIKENKTLTVNANSAYMTTGDLTLDKNDLSIAGKLYVGGNFSAPSLNANNGAQVFVGGNATLEDKSEVTNQAAMYVNGKLSSASKFELNSSSSVTVACSAEFKDHFYVTNSSVFEVLNGGYLNSMKMTTLDSHSRLLVGSKGYLSLSKLHIPNSPTVSVVAIGSEYAVVEAESIHVNHNDLRKTFQGLIGLHYGKLLGSGSQESIEFLSTVKVNGDDNTYIPAGGCNPGFGTPPSEPEPEQHEIIIDHIANVENPDPDHTHDISATCVQMAGNNAYVSFHRQGADYSGCVEVIRFDTPETFSLVSYMRSVDKRDFNHLIVDENKVYLTGGENKGAFLAYIPLSDGIFQSGDANQLSVVRLPGSDANCVVRNGGYYQVATTAGFHTLNASDYSTLQSKETPGSAKFIHLNGDKLLTLNLADRNSEQSAAVVNIYHPSDHLFSTPQSTISEGIISPVDGKNVSRVDGNHVYACLGGNGFVRYTDGAVNGTFKIDDTRAAVNGMDFDDRFIYIAYGSEGLYILNKETLGVVASYTYSGGKSANYVKAVNGYIYVAYGRNGLQVFRLIEK